MENKTNQQVMIGMSGGVDSAVTGLLLKRQNIPLSALFMKNWEEDDRSGYCSAEEDLADAEAVCESLDIPLHTRNFSHEYWEDVFEHFLAEYKCGRTPNPDILCNREIKFKAFLDHAVALGADKIATGHYARVDSHAGKYRLLKAVDKNKDQSYFLYTLGQEQLSKTLFPLGELQKSEVRAMAETANLVNSAKKDSTGICFIGERPFREFLSSFLPAQKGHILDQQGERIGTHQGSVYYTLGQREGLGIGGRSSGNGEPWFVAAKNVSENTLTAVQGHDHPALFANALRASELSWVAGEPLTAPMRCSAKIRYRQSAQDCELLEIKNGIANVRFDQPQRAITPGQSVVFYDNNICLGGGVINDSFNS